MVAFRLDLTQKKDPRSRELVRRFNSNLNTDSTKVRKVKLYDSVTFNPRAGSWFDKLAKLKDGVSSLARNPSSAVKTLALGLEQGAERLENRLLDLIADPNLHQSTLSVKNTRKQREKLSQENFNWVIEIKSKPGVTDNPGSTAAIIANNMSRNKQDAFSSRLYLIEGNLSQEDVEKIARTLYNSQIQEASILRRQEFEKNNGTGMNLPYTKLGKLKHRDLVHKIALKNLDKGELLRIAKEGIPTKQGQRGEKIPRNGPLQLSLDEIEAIKNHFGDRAITDVELESIAQTWSEHCKHSIFASQIQLFEQKSGRCQLITQDGQPVILSEKGLYKEYIKKATEEIMKKKPGFCKSVFSDNAGAIAFNDEFMICDKAETHNSPSAIDPYGGAITGILGVMRDILGFGMGAKVVSSAYGFCFGNPDDQKKLFKGDKEMLSPRRIMDGVIEGVKDGGNQSGVPTNQGFMIFDDRYKGKPLVFVRSIGLLPNQVKDVNGTKKDATKKQAKNGDHVVVIGGKVGKDGIHGATFSSEALTGASPSSAVQIGDAFTQKKLADALIEARDLGLYNSVTDNGAGGMSCSVAEMAKEVLPAVEDYKYGGFEVDLEKVPLKYPGLKPWEIWVSESQERMTLSVPDEKWEEFKKLMESRDVGVTSIGHFNDSGKAVVKYGNDTVMDMSMKFLHDGQPTKTLKAIQPEEYKAENSPASELESTCGDYKEDILNLIGSQNLASNEFISRQYDHEVQGGSVIKPLQGQGRVNGSTSVFKPLLGEKKAVVMSQGINPSYSDYDTYNMAASAVDTAIRNAVAAGADPDKIALMDNFCWYKGEDPESVWKLHRSAKALYESAIAFGSPFISGKDSMFNDFSGKDTQGNDVNISIPPTLLVSSISVLDDAEKAVSIDTKEPGDLVYVIGTTKNELGGSEFERLLTDKSNLSLKVPSSDPEKNLASYRALHKLINAGKVQSAISVEKGGLATALNKMSIAGQNGLNVDLEKLPSEGDLNNTAKLFSESQGRIVVTIKAEDKEALEAELNEIPHAELGTVIGKDFGITIKNLEQSIAEYTLEEATEKYRARFKDY